MFKSVFSKYFSVIALVVASGFLAMTMLQIFLSAQSLAEEKRALLQENAANISSHTATAATESHINDSGQVVYHLNYGTLTPFLNSLAEAIDADIFITDSDSEVLLYTGESKAFKDTATSRTIPPLSEEAVFVTGTLDGLYESPQYVASTPVVVRSRVLGYVFVTSPASVLAQTLKDNLKIYALSVLGALLLSSAVVYWMTYRFVRPLRQMAGSMRRYAQGDFSARVTVKGKDEVAQLADALNHMAVSLSSVETMRRSFVANVSHELKTPMTTISGFMDGMLDGTIPPERHSYYMKIVSDEVKRLSRLVRSMLELSRIDSGELRMNKVPLDLTELTCNVLVSFEQRIEAKSLHITGLESCGKMTMQGDYDLMGQVLYNLLDNAVKFTNDGGGIDIRMRRENGVITVAIRNSGDGIPVDEMPQIFERFYKSDRSRSLDKNGMGLGLYIVKTVIGLHQGEISVRSVPGEFTEFSFWVPIGS